CNARLEADTSESDTASSVLARVRSAKDMTSSLATVEEEPLSMPAARLIFYNTARDDGGVDEFDEGTWKYFSFKEQSLAALHRRLEEETRRHDFVVCRRSGPGLFPVVLDLPPGSSQMEFVLVPAPSPAVADGIV
uniref:DUF569 domain-containing protein n=1 Tax=Aegilops tauschii subsp. strangulata TaxID=200361 RepID=A0A452ZHI4_AEGTS